MKTADLLTLNAAFVEIAGNPDLRNSIVFSYAVAKNRRLIAPHVDAFVEAANPTLHPVVGPYAKARDAMLLEAAERDANGKPRVVQTANGIEPVLRDPAIATQIAENLAALFPNAETEVASFNAGVQVLLNLPPMPEIKLQTVALADLPPALTPRLVDMLYPMIEAPAE